MRAHSLGPIFTATWLALAATQSFSQERWAVFTDARGTRVEYPQELFSVRTAEEGEVPGEVFTTGDGRGRLHIFSIDNTQRLSPRAFMQAQFPAHRSTLTYDRVARNFFAISTRRDGMIVYLRCNFSSAAGGTLHCVDIRYPIGEKRAWDETVTRISRSLRPLPSK